MSPRIPVRPTLHCGCFLSRPIHHRPKSPCALTSMTTNPRSPDRNYVLGQFLCREQDHDSRVLYMKQEEWNRVQEKWPRKDCFCRCPPRGRGSCWHPYNHLHWGRPSCKAIHELDRQEAVPSVAAEAGQGQGQPENASERHLPCCKPQATSLDCSAS